MFLDEVRAAGTDIYDYVFTYILSVSIVKIDSIIYLVHVYVFSNGNIFSLAVVPFIPHMFVLIVESPVLWRPATKAISQDLGHTLFLRCFTFAMVWLPQFPT